MKHKTRSKNRFHKKIKTLLLIIVVALISYLFGFNHGEESVYKKKVNDAKLQKILYGRENNLKKENWYYD